MANDSLTITLKGKYRKYVEAEAEANGAASAEEFVRQLVHDDQQRKRKALDAELLAAMNEDEANDIEISVEELEGEGFCAALARKVASSQETPAA